MLSTHLKDKINLIQCLDLLCMSVLLPSVPPTILKSGGTLMHLGIMMSISAAVRMVSTTFYKELINFAPKRVLLKYSLMACCALNAALLLTSSFQMIMLNRILYVFVHQVPMLCIQLNIDRKANKEPVAQANPQRQRLVIGLLGLLIVGSLIDNKGGFYVVAALATLVSGAAVAITFQEESKENLDTNRAVAAISNTVAQTISSLRDIDIHFANWDALVVKALLLMNAKVVFMLQVVLVIFVFQGRGVMACSTAAYQTIAITLTGLVFAQLKTQADQFGTPKEILEKSLIVCAVCGVLQGFSQSQTFYLIMFIPFVVSRTFVDSYCTEVFEFKQNQKLRRDIETVTALTEIVGSLVIGWLFYLLKQNAYRLMAVGPILLIYYILKNKRFRTIEKDGNSETNKDK